MSKKITFNTLKIEGFAGIAEYFTFKLNNQGLTVIRGANGSKKTTIFSALSWVLYGKPLKKDSTIETWEHLRPKSWAGTMVSVSFYINDTKIKITRCKDYKRKIGTVKGGNRLIVTEAGVPLDITDKRDIQKYINALIGIPHNLFTTAIIFAQKGIRYIELPGPEKKEILEQAFKIDWLTLAQTKAKKERKVFAQDLAVKQKELEGFIREIRSLEEAIESVANSKKEFELAKEKEITRLQDKIDSLEKVEGVPNIDILTQLWEEAKPKLDKAQKTVTIFRKAHPKVFEGLTQETNSAISLKGEIKKLKDNIKTLKNATIPKCIKCGQTLDEALYKKTLKEDLALLKIKEKELSETEVEVKSLEDLWKEQQSLEGSEKEAQGKEEKARKEVASAKERNQAFEKAQGEIKIYKESVKLEKKKTFNDPTKAVQVNLFKAQKAKTKVAKVVKRLKREVFIRDWAINGPLSNSGIKSFLFNQLLGKLNKVLARYSQNIDLQAELVIDMDSARKNLEAIVYKGGAPVSYKDLSGGEMQIINALIAIATGEVLLEDTQVNLRVYDELTTFMDPDNVAIISQILAGIAETKSVYLVTHSHHLDVSAGTELLMEKQE